MLYNLFLAIAQSMRWRAGK